MAGGARPQSGSHNFSSVQPLVNCVGDNERDGFDIVIVEEFHHAAASSYERLLKRLNPKAQPGHKATPERADGRSVFEWFDSRIKSVSRLWDALDHGPLCPFHCFGVKDPTDPVMVRYARGR